MNRSAVLHIPMSQYAYGTDEEHIVIRLRAGRGDLTECILHYGDRACRLTPVLFTEQKMAVVAQTEEFDYWETMLEHPYKRLCYYFTLSDGREEVLYYEERFTDHTVDDRSEYYQLPFNHRADIVTPPEWAQDTIIYNIFPDSFATEYRYLCGRGEEKEWGGVATRGKLGGTIRGICENVEYLKNLGVNAIYINPIFVAGEYHKYDLLDYFHIDPCFGTDDDFHRLIDVFHANGLKVIIDGVFNHSGYYFAPWQDVLAKGPESEYYDWFMINEWPFDKNGQAAKKKQYYTFAFFDSMPKINTNNPKVRKYFVDICANWVENYGIDGIRLDVANEVSHRFCKELHARVKEINPDIYILGEIWHNALPWLRGDEFDAVMNYPLGQSIKDFWIDKSLTNEDFEYTINRCYTSYMQQTNDVLFNLLDSHDTKRLRSDVKNLDEYFAQIAVLFAMPGSPCIYYGTEIAMEGSYDPDCRRCMPWSDIEAGKYAERSRIISTLIHLRRQEPLLKSRNFHFPNDYAAYRRVIQFQKVDFPDCYVEVLINCCEEDVEVVPQGEILLERHYIDSTLLSNGILIRRIRK